MKKIFLFLFSLFITTMAFAVKEIDGIWYNLDDKNKTAEVTCNLGGSGGCYSGDVVIPNTVSYNGNIYSVTEIGNSAFYNCSSLTSITIPNSVTTIGNYVFRDCSSLTSVTWNAKNCGDFESKNTPFYYMNYDNPNDYKIFDIRDQITSFTFGDSVEYIPADLCSGMDNLSSVVISNSVIEIGDYAFGSCDKLRTVEIGNSIETIGSSAFSGCTAIYSISIDAIIPPIVWSSTFSSVSRTAQIKVPCNAVATYQASTYWNEFTNYIESPYSLSIKVNDNSMGIAVIIKQNSCIDVTAQVQAQALPGYEFVKWGDGFTENPHTLFVTENMTITAEFKKIGEEPEDKPGEGEIHNNFIVESADKTQGNVKITITAEAIEGFEFDHWSDGSTENPRVVTLDADVELYAYFRVAGTGLENSVISSANVYGNNGTLYVEGAETDYYVLDAAGRLIYSGRESALSLPRGVYVVNVGGEVQKVVL